MGATPAFKVYETGGAYVAACADASLAAALIGAALWDGAKVKHGGRIIWHEGTEEVRCAESYDAAAEIMQRRVDERRRADVERWAADDPQYRAMAIRRGWLTEASA